MKNDLRIFDENYLFHELLLTTQQKTKLRNAFNNNMQTYRKLSKAQISKIIQFGRFLGLLLSKIASPLMKVVVPLAKDILAPLRITAALQQLTQEFQKTFMILQQQL